jgi:hypothetical protein
MYIGTTLHDKAACWAHRGRSKQGEGIGLNDAISLLLFLQRARAACQATYDRQDFYRKNCRVLNHITVGFCFVEFFSFIGIQKGVFNDRNC